MAPEMLNVIAPPTACTARKTMSIAMPRDRPHAREDSVKTASPAMKRAGLPVHSDTLPKTRSRAVRIRR